MAARAGLAVSATVRKCTNLERLHRSGLSHDSGIGRVSTWSGMYRRVEFCSRVAKLERSI